MSILLRILGLLCISHSAFAAPTQGLVEQSDNKLALATKPALSAATALSASRPPSNRRPWQDAHTEYSVLLGAGFVPDAIKGQRMSLLPYETGENAGSFSHRNGASAATFGLEALYRLRLDATSTPGHFFNSLGTGIDLIQIANANQTGRVLEFNIPEFENYTYALRLKSTRLLAHLDFDFQPLKQQIIPFVQAGIGAARNSLSYTSTPIAPVIGPEFVLPDQRTWTFAYQAGAGFKYALDAHLLLSLRALYANMGKAHSSSAGNTALLSTPLIASVGSYQVLFGLTYSAG